MSLSPTSAAESAAIQKAVALLGAQQSPQQVMDAVSAISEGSPHFGQAQHIRAIATFQLGQPKLAMSLFLNAITHEEHSPIICLNLAHAAAASEIKPEVLTVLFQGITQWTPTEHLIELTLKIADLLRFVKESPIEQTTMLFEGLFLPLLNWACETREMNFALFLEGLLYERYVKARETEDHFGRCMQKIAPPLTKVGKYWRKELGPTTRSPVNGKIKVGFFIHNASMLAHIEVLLNTLKSYRKLEEQPLDPTVYCFSGKCDEMERALDRIGVRLVMLNEIYRDSHNTSWQRLFGFKELLAQEKVSILVWVSLVVMMPLAFAMRIAPVQVWFAMKYHNLSLEDVDGYLTGSALTRFATRWGRRWRMLRLGLDDWFDPSLVPQAAAIRKSWGGKLILGTLARTEKMTDPSYLQAMVDILRTNPNVVFLWAGREPREEVVEAFRAGGVLEQTHFIGWVNTRLYAQVFDVFLDTFPFPCGFTLYQAMAAAKPVLIYDSPEAAQTGLWNFIQPLVDGSEGSLQERQEMQLLLGDNVSPGISVARSPKHYFMLANQLISDEAARMAGGKASAQFIQKYFSDPREMGESLIWHILDLSS